MGAFDDLIPTAPASRGVFDDLIPAEQSVSEDLVSGDPLRIASGQQELAAKVLHMTNVGLRTGDVVEAKRLEQEAINRQMPSINPRPVFGENQYSREMQPRQALPSDAELAADADARDQAAEEQAQAAAVAAHPFNKIASVIGPIAHGGIELSKRVAQDWADDTAALLRGEPIPKTTGNGLHIPGMRNVSAFANNPHAPSPSDQENPTIGKGMRALQAAGEMGATLPAFIGETVAGGPAAIPAILGTTPEGEVDPVGLVTGLTIGRVHEGAAKWLKSKFFADTVQKLAPQEMRAMYQRLAAGQATAEDQALLVKINELKTKGQSLRDLQRQGGTLTVPWAQNPTQAQIEKLATQLGGIGAANGYFLTLQMPQILASDDPNQALLESVAGLAAASVPGLTALAGKPGRHGKGTLDVNGRPETPKSPMPGSSGAKPNLLQLKSPEPRGAFDDLIPEKISQSQPPESSRNSELGLHTGTTPPAAVAATSPGAGASGVPNLVQRAVTAAQESGTVQGIEQARAETEQRAAGKPYTKEQALADLPTVMADMRTQLANLEATIKGNQLKPAENNNPPQNQGNPPEIAPAADLESNKPETTEDLIKATVESARRRVAEMKAAGEIPEAANTFSDWQEHTDANMLVSDPAIGKFGKANGWKQSDYIDFTNKVIATLNQPEASPEPSPKDTPAQKTPQVAKPVAAESPSFTAGQTVAVRLSNRSTKEHLGKIIQLQPDGSATVQLHGEKTYRTLRKDQFQLSKTDADRAAKAEEIASVPAEQQAQVKADAAEFAQIVEDYAPLLEWAPAEAYDRNTVMQEQGIQNARLRAKAIDRAMRAVLPEGQGNSLIDRARALPRLVEYLQQQFPGDNSIAKRRALEEFGRSEPQTPTTPEQQARAKQDAQTLQRIAAKNPSVAEFQNLQVNAPGGGRDASGPTGQLGGNARGKSRITAAEQKAIGELDRIFGTHTIVVDSPGAAIPFNGARVANSNIILLHARTAHPLLTVMGHELWHHIERTNPSLADEVKAALAPLMQNPEHFLERMRKRNQSQEDAESELLGDFLGDNFGRKEFWDDLKRREPNLFGRLARIIKAWLDKLIAKLKGEKPKGFESEQYFKDLEQARHVVSNAVIKAARETQYRRAGVPADVATDGTDETQMGNFSKPEGDDLFGAPETVEEQKARLKAERLKVSEREAKAAMQERAAARLTGQDIDTTQEMFGGADARSTRQDKAGQGSLFSKPEGEPTPGNDWQQLKQELQAAEAQMLEAIRNAGNPSRSIPKAEAEQAKALATARVRELQERLSSHPDRYSNLSLKELDAKAAEVTDRLREIQNTPSDPGNLLAGELRGERYQLLKDARAIKREKLNRPEYVAQVLKRSEALTKELRAAKSSGDTTAARHAVEDLMELQDGELGHINPQLIESVRKDLVARGELEALTPASNRTLGDLTAWLRANKIESPRLSLKDRVNLGKRLADEFAAGKTKLEHATARARSVWQAFKAQWRAPKQDDEPRAIFKEWHYEKQFSGLETHQWIQRIRADIPQKVRRMAISVWLDADGDKGLLTFQRDAVPARYQAVWDAALKLTPTEQALARQIKQDFESKLADGQLMGLIGKGRENYGVPQIWAKAPEHGANYRPDAPGPRTARNPLAKLDPRDPFFALERTHESYFDGIMAKGVPKSLDISDLVGVYNVDFHGALADRSVIKALKDAKMPDGTPAVMVSGGAKIEMLPNGARTQFVDSNWRPKDAVTQDGRPYQTIDHWALRGWTFAAKDTAGNPIMVKGDFLVHPDLYRALKTQLEGKSALRDPDGPLGDIAHLTKFMLESGAFLKASKFAAATFHGATLAEHMMTHAFSGMPSKERLTLLNPFVFGVEVDPAKNLELANLMRHGMDLGFGGARMLFEEGLSSHGGILSKVPGLGDGLAWLSNGLFQEYLPRLKVRMGSVVLHANLKRYSKPSLSGPALTEQQIYELTASQVNAAFGGQNWKLMGRSRTFLDVNRLLFTAPDFLLSRAKVVGQAGKPYNAEQRYFLIAQAALVYALARILNYLLDDDPHWEAENALRVIHKNRAYSARFIVNDIGHLLQDPAGFAGGRLGPWPKALYESITGRDMRSGARIDVPIQTDNGALRATQILLKDLAMWGLPIGTEGFLPGATGREQTTLGQFGVGLLGVGSQRFTPETEMYRAAAEFNRKSTDPKTLLHQQTRDEAVKETSVYRKLDVLLEAEDYAAARKEYQSLLADGRTADGIKNRYKAMSKDHLARPFSGSQEREKQFKASLTPEQLREYQRAIELRKQREQAFQKMLKAPR